MDGGQPKLLRESSESSDLNLMMLLNDHLSFSLFVLSIDGSMMMIIIIF